MTAGLIQHTAPCFGFVIKESDVSGPLNMAKVKQRGVPVGPLLSQLKVFCDARIGCWGVIHNCIGWEGCGAAGREQGAQCGCDRLQCVREEGILLSLCMNIF